LDDEYSSDYPPFALLRDIAYKRFKKIGLPPEAWKKMLIIDWAAVHGMVALVTNRNVQYSGDWGALLNITREEKA
jgi:hypothetical protein